MSKFTSVNSPALEATGRVNTGGCKLPLAVTIENDAVLRCTNSEGFSLTVNRIGDIKGEVPSSNVECVLADGTVIPCQGRINHTDGRLRLDALDQTDLYWFWFEIRPNFRRALQ